MSKTPLLWYFISTQSIPILYTPTHLVTVCNQMLKAIVTVHHKLKLVKTKLEHTTLKSNLSVTVSNMSFSSIQLLRTLRGMARVEIQSLAEATWSHSLTLSCSAASEAIRKCTSTASTFAGGCNVLRVHHLTTYKN